VPVDALESEINAQVGQVRAALRQARAAHDDYLADLHQAELDGLARTADEHGVPIHADSEVPGRVIDLTTDERTTADLRTAEPEQARSA
jgi:hypothetical protein